MEQSPTLYLDSDLIDSARTFLLKPQEATPCHAADKAIETAGSCAMTAEVDFDRLHLTTELL